MALRQIQQELRILHDREKAELLQGFFKTKPGEYGEGDIFLGITVPEQRKISKKYYSQTSPRQVQELLDSKIHDERSVALFMLIEKYKRADSKQKKNIFDFYLKNLNKGNINNWDLVDISAPSIIGDYLLDNEEQKNILYLLVSSNDLWKKRVAVLSTFAFIKLKQFEDSLKIAKILLNDEHDLIHKAVGWMLREIGKKNQKIEEAFLKKHYKEMPRTMLRYSIERFPEKLRQKYLKGEI